MKRSGRLYSDYVNSINTNKTYLIDKISNLSERRHVVLNTLLNYRGITICKDTNQILVKIDEAVINGTKEDFTNLRKILTLKANKKISHLLITYRNLSYKEYLLRKELKPLIKHPVSLKMFNFFVSKYFDKISHNLLRGNTYYLGKGLSRLYVVKKERTINDVVKPAVDWKESLDLLKLIAKNNQPDIYLKYINKKLTKEEFIASMKPHTYNKDNTSLPRWLVYRTDNDNCWFWWHKAESNVANKSAYRFIPSNYINTEIRSQNQLLETMKSVDEIIEHPLLGNRDKLQMVTRFDKLYDVRYVEYQVKN